MHKKSVYKVIVAIVVALAFVLPVAAFASNEEPTNNSEIIPEIYSAGLCPLLCYDAEYIDITLDPLEALGDTFYAYNAYPAPEGPVSFQSDNPGSITLLKETTSSDFIAGGTWAEDTWYGCQFNNGWLWTIDEVTGDMTLIGGGGIGLNGLAYDLTTGLMYGASGTELYSINMNNGDQTLVGSLNTGGLVIGIAFDGEGNLYGEDLNDNLYSINPLTGAATLIGPLGIDLNYAQDMAYDITWDVLYLAAYTGTGQLYTCDVTTGACMLVGNFQGGAEITGFAMPYIITYPPETPEQPDGPTEGIVGVEYIFLTSTNDPEGEQVSYLWDWGDETPTEWTEFYDSGENATASHSWDEPGDYNITVKAKDVYNEESDWSDTLTVCILIDSPILEIGNITGGLFKVSTVIGNIGGVDANGVNWSITLDGGLILFGKETSRRIVSIPVGEEKIISSSVILGFGKTVITVSTETTESSDTAERDAFVFLFFIL